MLPINHFKSFEEIRLNRLESRVLEELSFRPMLLPTDHDLISQLVERQEYIVQKTQKQIRVMEEIQSFFPENKPLLIKGFTSAALCDNPNHYRLSGDLDLFCDDINRMKSVLKQLGYKQTNKTPAPHEDSFFERDGVYIEIHKYFPILMEPQYNVQNFSDSTQTFLPDLKIRKLDYQTLLSYSVMLSNSVSPSILVTDIEMTIFILCAHTYKDLFWQPYKVPKTRLVELIEICDLVSLPSFNLDTLISISEQMNAIHILKYVFTLIHHSLHVPIPKELLQSNDYYIKLANDSYSPYKLVDQHYFEKMPFMSFEDVLETIGYEKCIPEQHYYTKNLTNTHYASTDSSVIDFSFSISVQKNRIVFTVNLSRPLQDGDNFCIILDNNIFTHIWFDSVANSIRVYGTGMYREHVQNEAFSLDIFFDTTNTIIDKAIITVGNNTETKKTVSVIPVGIGW